MGNKQRQQFQRADEAAGAAAKSQGPVGRLYIATVFIISKE
jgi:hypothetical protein